MPEVNSAEQVSNTGNSQQPSEWEARFKGLQPVVERLTIENRKLQDQLQALTSQIEQGKAELTIKDTEKTVAVGERDKMLQTLTQENSSLKSELDNLRALKLKVDTAKKLNRPDLLAIAEAIPNMTDPQALETVMNTFTSYADGLVRAREQQLMAGQMPPTAARSSEAALPANSGEWERYVNQFPLGSKDRTKAMDQYWAWGQSQNK